VNQAATRAAAWALGLAYAAAWAVAGWLWTSPLNDLDYFSLPAVRIALNGHPFQVYAVRYQGYIANDNGPLSLAPLTAVAGLASRLGWLDDEHRRRMLILAAFSVFSLLMAREAVAAIDRIRGARLEGWWRLLAYGVFLTSPILWNSVLGYGHIEQPMTIWLVLLGVRTLASDRAMVAGFCFGLALLTRSLAALPLIPLVLLLLVRRRWTSLSRMVGSSAAVVALGLLPFLLADPANTIYSLVTHRGDVPVAAGSFWQLVVGTPYEWLPQHLDVLFVLGTAGLASLIVLLCRGDLEPWSADLYGLLALTAVALPLLAKNVWPYYFLDAYVFGAIWWLGSPGWLAFRRRLIVAAIPIVAMLGTLATEYEMGDPSGRVRLAEGVGMGVILAVLLAALAVRLAWRRRPAMAVAETSPASASHR
jgi:hypothetical protein